MNIDCVGCADVPCFYSASHLKYSEESGVSLHFFIK